MSALIPKNPRDLPAVWAYVQSAEYKEAVHAIDRSLKVTNSALVKVPFDIRRWQTEAETSGPLPEPYSNDPTQWIFCGDVVPATEPLQVGMVRLLGYRWPDQAADQLDDHADADGLVCIPPVAGEHPAAERLRAILATAYGARWSAKQQDRLLAGVGFGGHSLDAWLRDGFFEQHCRLFGNRPFIWQVWDGRPDGFSVLINYHKLDGALLDRLIYTYLGGWIDVQRDAAKIGTAGADGRLEAAVGLQKRLQAIREGEPPYDIYVRWKAKHEQPIGWDPDLDDGIRLNIRPFVLAGVLRRRFTINWNKDKGGNTPRENDLHLSLAEKRAARNQSGALV